jgi:hypothetical protein
MTVSSRLITRLPRYGFLSLKQLDVLREGLEMYTEALEQMSIMQSEGKTEETTDYVIDGVKFSIVDKLGSLGGIRRGAGAGGAGEAGEEGGYEVANQEGVRLMIMDSPGQGGADEEDEEALLLDGGEIVDVEAMQAEDEVPEE